MVNPGSPECDEAQKALVQAKKKGADPGVQGCYQELTNAQRTLDDTICRAKRKFWQDYIESLNPRIQKSRILNTIRGMGGRAKQRLSDKPIVTAQKSVTSDSAKADLACQVYAKVSRVNIKNSDEKKAYRATRHAIAKNQELEVSEPISIFEVKECLNDMKPKSAGRDEIHPYFLKNLGDKGRETLLQLLNRSWLEYRVPHSWKAAVIGPILKRGPLNAGD